MSPLSLRFTVLALLPLAACAQSGPSKGYLSSPEMPDILRILPPAPQEGDARYVADLSIFRQTRGLEGSSRWKLALSDDNVSTAGLFQAYRCALKITVTAADAPKTWALVARANSDAGAAATTGKNFYQHKRPFLVAEGNVCVSPQMKSRYAGSADYPSGHAAASWETALVLAEVAPDAATGVLERAREFGESRVVCGVHNASAIEAGRVTATAIFAAQATSTLFRADVEAAKLELASLRRASVQMPEGCAMETQTLAVHPY